MTKLIWTVSKKFLVAWFQIWRPGGHNFQPTNIKKMLKYKDETIAWRTDPAFVEPPSPAIRTRQSSLIRIEKLLANWNISWRERFYLWFIQGRSSQEQCNDSFSIFDLLPVVSPINSSKSDSWLTFRLRKLLARQSNILLDSFVRVNWVPGSSQLPFIAATWVWSSRSFWLKRY